MRNPLRSEADTYRFLWIVVGGAIVIVVAAVINKWVGVAAAVIAFAALGWWLLQEPVPGARRPAAAGRLGDAAGAAPRPRRRAAGNGERRGARTAPRCSSSSLRLRRPLEALTGAVDDRRARCRGDRGGARERLLGARAEVGADDPALAAEDALRVFGADEVLVVGDDEMVDAIRERVAIPVSRA